jgi:hypothetical protein
VTTPLDSVLPAAVASVVSTFGVDVTISDVTPTFDPSDGGQSTWTPTSMTVRVSPPNRHAYTQPDGSVAYDLRVVVPATLAAFEPRVGHRVTIGGVSYRVREATPLRSGDEVAAYKLSLEAGG